MSNFNRGESLDVEFRIERAQVAKQIEIPFLLQSRMETANHVDFGDPERQRFRDRLNNFARGVLEGVRVPFLSGKSTELAGEHTDVRIVDVTIVDVSGEVAVLSLANDVGHYAERVQVVRAIQIQGVVLRDPGACLDFLSDRSKLLWDQCVIHPNHAEI